LRNACRCARQIPGKAQLFGQHVRRSRGQNGHGDLAARQSVHCFIDRAVSAAHDRKITRLRNGLPRENRGFSGRGGFLEFSLNAGLTEDAPRFVQLRHTAAASGGGIHN